MIVFGYQIGRDNQIEASFDFELGESPKMNGYLKEGYYWIGDKAWYLSSFSLNLEKNKLIARVNTLYDDLPFDLRADLAFRPHFKARLTLQETCNDQRVSNPLVVQTDWNEKEGFFIQSIDGGVCGLDFAFHHNPKESLLNKIALTGQLKVNVPKFAQLMPQEFQETVSEFEIGKGYELSGGLFIHKTDLEKRSFSRNNNGNNFQLMG